MPLGEIQANLIQDLNINFRSLVPEARVCSPRFPFWEPFWLCFISMRPKRNKPEKGVGTHETWKKIGRGSWCAALSLLTNLQNLLAVCCFHGNSVSNPYQWRMMMFVVCLCGEGSRVDWPTWENAPRRWNVWKSKAASSQSYTHYFKLLLFQTLFN